jgi:hypothetical protein
MSLKNEVISYILDLIGGSTQQRRITLMEGASVFKEGSLNTNTSTRRERCIFLYPVALISKTPQQQIKTKRNRGGAH